MYIIHRLITLKIDTIFQFKQYSICNKICVRDITLKNVYINNVLK